MKTPTQPRAVGCASGTRYGAANDNDKELNDDTVSNGIKIEVAGSTKYDYANEARRGAFSLAFGSFIISYASWLFRGSKTGSK